ncbi:MAG: hypothetical protein G01um101448_1165 [Parcubacteria group bacterium Gr01-1014_48]|nr:MAG: hypothetical protein Greene041614_1146 [Parcubacteria group bacterium Greene0416_14]TSC71468.1 MAG: hypothetical protein G01um101448_1165 [Parcubacteria group bacterium Gr01-1014_48]TSC99937.1 MAG: hypothetical protein Greene101415_1032 [Parcubacteria group bacterium Greene1014_15]TSD06692.1 MAG: hypothetical protein Greene07144_1120 [Parcubacteria group bacterium Greene0714_4]
MVTLYLEYPEGLLLPTRYYLHPQHNTHVVLIGTIHVGEENFYRQVDKILQNCDTVIYEEPLIRDNAAMEQLDHDGRQRLEQKGDLNDSFLAAIFLPMPPQKFARDHGLVRENRNFNYAQDHWVSGDGAWHSRAKEETELPDDTWEQIQDAIKTLPASIKREKVKAAKAFLRKVNAGKASIQEYISFSNLHEKEILAKIYKHTLVDIRDQLAFEVFDNVIETRAPACVGIKFGNGHLPGMDAELLTRGYRYIATMWLRILTIP